MALTIAGLLLAAVLNSTVIAQRTQRRSLDRHQDSEEAAFRLAAAWPRITAPGQVHGPADEHGEPWTIVSSRLSGERGEGPALCAVAISVGSAPQQRKALTTVRFCDLRSGSHG